MKKVAYITGVNGQDGSYISELLLKKNYKVYGLVRRTSTNNFINIEHLFSNPDFEILRGDLTDLSSLTKHIQLIKPDEIYHLGAQSHVRLSFDQPISTAEITGLGTLNVLEAVRANNLESLTKIYYAGTSELFGNTKITPQNEETPFHPRSPYSVAKIYGYWICVNYVESYNMFISRGILFNHESERRGDNFVTQKIAKNIAEIYLNKKEYMTLGNIDSKRDWGHAEDYVKAMYLMLQQDKCDTFVIGTNTTYSVKDFLIKAFNVVGIDNWEEHVQFDEKLMRPSEVPLLKGDYTKAKKILGWEPTISFDALVNRMVKNQINKISKEKK